MGWSQNAQILAENVTIIGGVPNSGLFVYSSAPGVGDLAASVSAITTTDKFGNTVNKGFASYGSGGTSGITAQMSAGAIFLFNAANAGGLIGAPASVNAAGLGLAVPASNADNGAMVIQSPAYNAGAEFAALVMSGESQDGTKISNAQFINGNGTKILPVAIQQLVFPPQAVQPAPPTSVINPSVYAYGDTFASSVDIVGASGMWGHVAVNRIDNAQHTVTQAVLTNITNIPTNILGNDAQNGTIYRISCGGNGVQGSTAQALSMQILFGATALGSTTMAAGTIPINTAFHWNFVGNVKVETKGVSATVRCWGVFEFSVAAAGGSSGTAAFDTNSATVDTTATNQFVVQMRWASTTGAPTITSNGAILERLGV